ncbi:unnamed protein product [Darwinula stevensoni]|uniref:Activator of Hsp90 ATPase homologue 1/2-like C-terminal domain-containing protein n=1 Tax=Darwinula stevensoni TaxID=69355 RepID=A0A7R9FQH5_9CRUS|nr:unnamed protein product [Darwinula stevensoni]CAG0899802.1 unnamed protein product [Darwinula stevensoni]
MNISRWALFWGCVMLGIAFLSQLETDTSRWACSQTGVIDVSPDELFAFLTQPDHVTKWFAWVSHLKAGDSRPIGIGKRYYAIYNIPFYGEYAMMMKVTEWKENRRIALSSDNLFKPRMEVEFESTKLRSTKLTFVLTFTRPSLLFQTVMGPVLYFLSKQQLRHSLLFLQMMFTS